MGRWETSADVEHGCRGLRGYRHGERRAAVPDRAGAARPRLASGGGRGRLCRGGARGGRGSGALRGRQATASGHRVALLLENRPQFFFHYLALNGLGAGIVPINPDYRHDEVAYLLEHSEAGAGRGAAAPVEPTCAAPRRRAPGRWRSSMRCELPAALPPPAAPARAGEPGLETECALLYTSGTTGRPKGCMLSNFYFLTSGRTYCGLGGLIEIRPGRERFYNPLPLYHMNHLALTATAAILTANALVLPERFSPTRWWPEVSATGATIIHYLGVVAPMLLNQPPGAGRPGARRALRPRRRHRAAAAPGVRGALRLPHDRGVGHDRDRAHHGRQPTSRA